MRRLSSACLALSLISQSSLVSAGQVRAVQIPRFERPAFAASVACETTVDDRLNTIVTHVRVRNTGIATLAAGTPIQYDLGGGLVLTYPLDAKLARGETISAFDRIGRYPDCSATILQRSVMPHGTPIPPAPPVGVGLRCETSLAAEGATQAFLVNEGAAAVPAGTRIRVTMTGASGSTSVEVVLAEPLAPGQRRQVLIFPVEGQYDRCKADVL